MNNEDKIIQIVVDKEGNLFGLSESGNVYICRDEEDFEWNFYLKSPEAN